MKVDIISGFLGAGKTTLIKKMIQEAFSQEKVALIENEFGEIGIDGGFLKESGIQITEMNSGCICCTLVGDFEDNLRSVVNQYNPERIIIEPSGVGKLSDVMKSVMDLEAEMNFSIHSLVTVVNAKKAIKQIRAFGEFYGDQLEHATTIVLSRTKDISSKQLQECVNMIREKNKEAAIITTPWDELTASHLLEVMEGQDSLEKKMLAETHHLAHEQLHQNSHLHQEGCCGHHKEHGHHNHGNEGCCGHHKEHEHHDHHDHHHADEIFQSWGLETPHIFERKTIEHALKTMAEEEEYDEILRAKGMVEVENNRWIYFDLVPGEYEIREGAPDYTGRLCVIGTNLKEENIKSLFGMNAEQERK